jgi:hypothetical protein
MKKGIRWILAAGAASVVWPAVLAADDASPQNVAPTLVTVHAKAASLTEVLRQIAEQSGMPLTTNGGQSASTITIDADRQPFWSVLGEVCDQAHSSLGMAWNNPPQVMVMVGSSKRGRRVIDGPVIASFQQIDHRNRLTASADRRDSCNISVLVMWEPRLNVLFTDAVSTPSAAQDENGLSLLPPPPADSGQMFGRYQVLAMNGPQGGFQSQFSLPLNAPPSAGRKIAHLQGTLRLWAAGKTDHVQIDNLARLGKTGSSCELPDLGTIKVNKGNVSDQMVEIPFTLTRRTDENDEQWDRRRILFLALHARVLDSDGNVWGQNPGRNGWGGGPGEMSIYVNVPRADGVSTSPAKLVLEGTVNVQEIDAAYDLRDLPLP